MSSHPPAEIELTVEAVDRLIAAQHPELRGPLRLVAHGWDNDMYRLGDDLAVRLPRREVAARLTDKEQRWLPVLADLLPVAVPVPVATGSPADGFPWPWSIVPWFHGQSGIDRTPAHLDTVAEQLAEILLALHVPAPDGAPINSVRGIPMIERDDVVRERLLKHPALLREWADGVAAAPWSEPPVWIHGDVHPGNIVVESDRIVALIDFGDLGSGDPACDLAAAWLMFTQRGRERFRWRLGRGYDDATWTRARGWAAAMASLVVDVEDAGFRRMATHAIGELARDRRGSGGEK